MTTVNRSPDCGHSPKNKMLENLAIARCSNDTDTLEDLLANDIEWTVVGQAQHVGKDDVLAAIKASNSSTVKQLDIIHVSSHGKIGSVNGRLTLTKGNSIDFCDVCEFANTKGTSVSKITSYIIATTRPATDAAGGE